MSQTIFTLSKPNNEEKIDPTTLAYFRSRNKNRAHEIVVKEFERSGLTQKALARRMGRGTDVVCRLLGAPGNWTLDTISDLLFAISSGEAAYAVSYPLSAPTRNFRKPEWLENEEIRQGMQDPQGWKPEQGENESRSLLDYIRTPEQ